MDQITQQLKSANLDVGDTEDSPLAAQNMVKTSSDTQLDSEVEIQLILHPLLVSFYCIALWGTLCFQLT